MSNIKPEIISYRPELVERARELRKNLTPAETLLWKNLKGKKINGFDFDRQKPIDRFIVDFYCKILKLAIEVDGQSHDFKIEYDLKRQKRMESFGIKVIRFTEKEVLHDLDNVLTEIKYWTLKLPSAEGTRSSASSG